MITCIAPDCTAEAATAFVAAEDGRLAGRDWERGDILHFCIPHAMDVYDTISRIDPSQVAEWLRPDAADPPNTWRAPGRLAHPY